jgi:multiple sugar transport system permease protein
MAAYSFARMKWRGKKVLFLLVIILTIIPFEAVVLTFLAQWGSYLWPVLMVSDTTVRPLPLAISIFQNQQPPEWGQVLAFGTMFIVPVLAVFLVFQRWFVASISSSAIKG